MEERDTKPFESVQTALSLFEKRDCHNSCNSSENGRKEKEVDFLLNQLANCKVQLEINEFVSKQTSLKLEVYRRTVDDLSAQLKISHAEIDKYKEECRQAQTRIAQIQSENKAIAKLLLESGEDQHDSLSVADELKNLKKELLLMGAKFTAEEKSKIMAKGLSKKSLRQVSAVNESVISSAVAAVEADEERSASFFRMEAELHNAKEALSQSYFDLTDDLETELLAKTIQVHYFQSELAQAKLSHKVSEHASSHLALMEAEKKKMQEELRGQRDKANDLHCQIEAFSSKMQAMQHEMNEMKGRELESEVEIATLKADLEAANSGISDLRLNLEEATKRAELAEKAKAAVEDQLRKWREERQQRRTPADSITELSSIRKDTGSGNHSLCLPPPNKSTAPAAASLVGTTSPVLENTVFVPVPLARILNMKL